MMGNMVALMAVMIVWLLIATALGVIHPVLTRAWIVLGLVLLVGHSGRLVLRLRSLVKEHPNMRWKLP